MALAFVVGSSTDPSEVCSWALVLLKTLCQTAQLLGMAHLRYGRIVDLVPEVLDTAGCKLHGGGLSLGGSVITVQAPRQGTEAPPVVWL